MFLSKHKGKVVKPMEEKNFTKTELVPLAKKSVKTLIILPILTAIGFVCSVSLLVTGLVLRDILTFLLSFVAIGIGFVFPLVALIVMILKPSVLINSDGEVLNFYYQKQWMSIKLSLIRKVKYKLSSFFGGTFKSGDIILIADGKQYAVYDIRCVDIAVDEIKKLLKMYGNTADVFEKQAI